MFGKTEYGLRYDRLDASSTSSVTCVEWKRSRGEAFSAMYSSEPLGAFNKIVVCREVGPTRVVTPSD